MSFKIANPSPFLAPYIKHYWCIEECLSSSSSHHVQRIIPNGLTELIFYLGDKPQTDDAQNAIQENVLITGQQNRFYDIKVKDTLSLFSIVFKANGLMMFFNIPVKEFYNQSIPLKYIIKENVGFLESKLSETNSFNQKISIAEIFLKNLIQNNKNRHENKRMTHIIDLINQKRGILDIKTLASEACLSRKQFERLFVKCIGISPKQFLRIVRFQNALYQKRKNKHINLTSLTYNCGYYDQSHFINEFKRLTGMTPKKYFDQYESYSDYFQ